MLKRSKRTVSFQSFKEHNLCKINQPREGFFFLCKINQILSNNAWFLKPQIKNKNQEIYIMKKKKKTTVPQISAPIVFIQLKIAN